MKGSLRDFRALVALDEERHFGRAAQRLGMTQPQLSELIARLEASMGFPLFTRRPQVVPTAAGAALADTARNILSEVQKGIERANHLHRGSAGLVRLGFVTTIMLTGIAEAFGDFQRAMPQVQLRFREGFSRELTDALQADLLDIVFARLPCRDPHIRSAVVHAETLLAVFPEQAGEEREVPLVLFPRERAPAFYDQIFRAAGDAGFAPGTVHHVEGWQSILALVRNGFGMTVAPACLRNLGWSGLRYEELVGPEPRVNIYMLWKEGAASPAAHAFARHILGRRPMQRRVITQPSRAE
jgi:DNA-binding transcriptional LysR family regulator